MVAIHKDVLSLRHLTGGDFFPKSRGSSDKPGNFRLDEVAMLCYNYIVIRYGYTISTLP